MFTDWLIVARVALELDRTLRGARIGAAGIMADGRFALPLAGPGGERRLLAIDPFGPTPMITLQAPEALRPQHGWVRALTDTLDGLRIERIRARHGDRLIAIDCTARSRFGVSSSYRLVAELVPKFGNIVLLKDNIVVAAAKEFTRAQNARRSTQAGEPYEAPPLPEAASGPSILEEALAVLTGTGTASEREIGDAARALRRDVPLLPTLIASSLLAHVAKSTWDSPRALADHLRQEAQRVVAVAEADGEVGNAFVYRDEERLVQVHVVPLHQFAALREERVPALLPVLQSLAGATVQERSGQAFAQRLATLAARVTKRRALLEQERATLERERADAEQREMLRRSGEALYAHLHEVPAGAASFTPASDPGLLIPLDPLLDAKANAAAIFKRYRKAVAKLEHVERRLERLQLDEEHAQQLIWELERAEMTALDELAESIDRLEHRLPAKSGRVQRARPALEVRVADDARILIGRSPSGNADLTFRVARPSDLWFHVRGTPGAHVVLRIDSRREPREEELQAAAELAAYHSKARESDVVAVDYTERKHVRRQQNAAPGLVWYTNARTRSVRPRASA